MSNLKNIVSEILRKDGNSWWLFPFFPASVLYSGVVRLRNVFYQAGLFKIRKLGCKVISIGNITVGGTGKTPMVIMLANLLKEKGYKPAVLSRGYKGKKKGRVNIVSNGATVLMTPAEAGDEPVLIAESASDIPVITGKSRYLTGTFAIEHFGTDVLILDDAFQHRSIFRDVDIVLLDKTYPYGNGFLIPRGELREPASALERADIIVKTGVKDQGPEVRDQKSGTRSQGSGIRDQQSGTHIFEAYRKPVALLKGVAGDTYPLDHLNGKRIFAFAGIARPESFKNTIESLRGELVDFIDFPDHHAYTQRDLTKIKKTALRSLAPIILTTEKDGIKLIDFPDYLRDIYLLKIEMEISPSQKEFEDVILEKLKV